MLQKSGGQIKNTISDKVSPIIQNVQSKWEQIKTNAVNKWGDIKSSIGNKVGEIKTAVSDKFNELVNGAKTWAQNMMNGFVQGIKDKIKSVREATANVINNIKDFLGFHSPAKEGEGRHIVEWGENMVLGFIDGMDNKTQTLRNRMRNLLEAPELTTNLDLGLNTMARPGTGWTGNNTTTNNTTNNSNFTLKIEKFINEREQDVERLVEEIEFYRNRKLAAKGG